LRYDFGGYRLRGNNVLYFDHIVGIGIGISLELIMVSSMKALSLNVVVTPSQSRRPTPAYINHQITLMRLTGV
jgi:hypothetical protein